MKYTCVLSQNKKTFTLIELLVVIAIIAILAAMLMPALGSVKGTAKKIECLAHFKTMGLGARMYSNDYNDEIPGTVGSYDIPITWHTGYLGVKAPASMDKWYINTNPSAYLNPKDPDHMAAKVLQCPTGEPKCIQYTIPGNTKVWAATRKFNTVFSPGKWNDWSNFHNGDAKAGGSYKDSRIRPSIFLYIECRWIYTQAAGQTTVTGHTNGDVNVGCFDGSAATWKSKVISNTWKEFGLKPNGNHDIKSTHDVF